MLVSEGAIEVALDWTAKPWDLAPLGIMVEEAGGRSTNVRGERTIYTGQLVSTNGKIHDEVLAILRRSKGCCESREVTTNRRGKTAGGGWWVGFGGAACEKERQKLIFW